MDFLESLIISEDTEEEIQGISHMLGVTWMVKTLNIALECLWKSREACYFVDGKQTNKQQKKGQVK